MLSSPDMGDALAMTFASPAQVRGMPFKAGGLVTGDMPGKLAVEYDPYAEM